MKETKSQVKKNNFLRQLDFSGDEVVLSRDLLNDNVGASDGLHRLSVTWKTNTSLYYSLH